MRRSWIPAALGALFLAACTIEQTPERYIDRETTPVGEIETSRQELTARLLSSAVAVRRGDRIGLVAALSPTTDAVVLLSGDGSEETALGRGEVVETIIRLASGAEVAMDDPLVTVAEPNNIAWFLARYRLLDDQDVESGLNFSGVFIRQDGEWRLVQGHLSPSVSPNLRAPPPSATPTGGG
ncbi:MAG: nuclear transport factor 2 family protein [Gemmatimonadota bacterium]